jgi:hypothetical protein
MTRTKYMKYFLLPAALAASTPAFALNPQPLPPGYYQSYAGGEIRRDRTHHHFQLCRRRTSDSLIFAALWILPAICKQRGPVTTGAALFRAPQPEQSRTDRHSYFDAANDWRSREDSNFRPSV